MFCPFARSIWDAAKAKVQLKLFLKSFSNMKLWVFAFLEKIWLFKLLPLISHVGRSWRPGMMPGMAVFVSNQLGWPATLWFILGHNTDHKPL
jgi:hypothetical protein